MDSKALFIVVVALAAAGCVHRAESVYESVVLDLKTDADPVDLSQRIRACTRRVRLDNFAGYIEVRHPQAFPREDALRIADDLSKFLPVAQDLLGEGSVNEVLYVLPMKRIPPSYKINIVRRGEKWRLRQVGFLLLDDESPLGSHEYWSQILVEIHEMAHHFIDLTLSGCQHNSPLIRWFEDGVCELTQALYRQRYVPADEAKELARSNTPTDARLFNPDMLNWSHLDSDDLTAEVGQAEADRYAVAHRMVRYIYDRDDGQSLRALREALERSRPQTKEQLDALLNEVLGLPSVELIEQARLHMERHAQR